MTPKFDSFHVFLKNELRAIRNTPGHEHAEAEQAVHKAIAGYKNIVSISVLQKILKEKKLEVDASGLIDALKKKRIEQTTALVKGVKKASEIKAPEKREELEFEEE